MDVIAATDARDHANVPLAPDALALLEFIKEMGRPPFETISHLEARELYARGRNVLQPPPEPVAEVRDVNVAGREGELKARLYRGMTTTDHGILPALIFFHGGGWVIGNLDTHDGPCRWLANSGKCAVISVDYRLAPEHKFPAGVEDAIAATAFISELAERFGIDRAHLAVGGDSAGGNLAAVVAINARDDGGPALQFQLLIYPSVNFGGNYPSYRQHTAGLPLTARTVDWFSGHYLRGTGDYAEYRASPLRASSHSGLPPAYVLTVGYDPILSEGEEYVRALQSAGVPVVQRHLPDQLHGFMTMGKFIAAAEIETKAAGIALGRALRETAQDKPAS
jgi:acetyl esterase